MGHVAYPPKNRLFEPFSGRFTPHPAHKSAPRAEWATHSGHRSPASRPTPHQRGEVLCRPSPAGYCLTPTANLAKTEWGPISTSDPSLYYVTEPGDSLRKNQTVSPRSSPSDRRPFSLGWNRSTPVAPGVPA